MSKFKMELTWHNCETCPPEEEVNFDLFFTDGRSILRGWYSIYRGYTLYDVDEECQLSEHELSDLWWADLTQTTRNVKRFAKEYEEYQKELEEYING